MGLRPKRGVDSRLRSMDIKHKVGKKKLIKNGGQQTVTDPYYLESAIKLIDGPDRNHLATVCKTNSLGQSTATASV